VLEGVVQELGSRKIEIEIIYFTFSQLSHIYHIYYIMVIRDRWASEGGDSGQ